jgi:pimeloyl-ACP methyl ester carboxylesterase
VRPPRPRRRLLIALGLSSLALGAGLGATGCTSLQPRSVARQRVPAAELLEVAGQLVHVTQAGSGEPVVLLHGFGESTFSYRLVAPALAARFRVIAVDLNGFGYTDRPRDPGAYTLHGQARLVLGVLDALGVERAHFVGHSYGGGLTIWIAAHHPERMRSMTLVDSAMPRYSTTRRTRAANLRPLTHVFLRTVAMRDRYVRNVLREAYFDDALATPAVTHEYLERLRIEGIDDAYYGLTAKNGEPSAEVDLARIGVPALLVWGEEDTLTPLANGSWIAAGLGGAPLVTIPRCGHVPMEEAPQQLLSALLPFLAGEPVPSR